MFCSPDVSGGDEFDPRESGTKNDTRGAKLKSYAAEKTGGELEDLFDGICVDCSSWDRE